ncbi:MAG: hypothetical protein H7210_11255 [Pyrinomonadaceae bacterium]|nr:hypothetical protein [Phycisphaerales bacterium]
MSQSSFKPLAIFSVAAIVPWIAAAAWVLLVRGSPETLRSYIAPHVTGAYLVMLVGVPSIVHWLVADLLDSLRPRLFLHGRAHRWGSAAARGCTAGLLALASAAALAPFLEPRFHGAWNVAVCSMFWTALVVLASARARTNHCGSCDYDLAQTPATALCPECGHRFSRV